MYIENRRIRNLNLNFTDEEKMHQNIPKFKRNAKKGSILVAVITDKLQLIQEEYSLLGIKTVFCCLQTAIIYKHCLPSNLNEQYCNLFPDVPKCLVLVIKS